MSFKTIAIWLAAGALGRGADFVATVTATRPLAFYRLDATAGKSLTGVSTYDAKGGVTSGGPGVAGEHFARLDGRNGYVLTTQKGGVAGAASMMAWVNLESLPSQERHFFYVAGESEYGNDLDLQFENDNALRFYTAAGGNLAYKPEAATLVGQWHMIVATLDTASRTRKLYWDGKQVATDQGSGQPGKKNAFSIGASTVFSGRWLKGGVEEVALWDRALTAQEVGKIYAAAPAAGTAPAATSGSGAGGSGATGPFATTAKVEVQDGDGPVKLKREEQIAIMFLAAFQVLEGQCRLKLQHVCTMDELLAGTPAGKLKYDPKVDPNYTYTLAVNGTAWEAHANAKKPGLMGFCYVSKGMSPEATYSRSGTASAMDKQLGGRSVEGDMFAVW